MVVDDNVVYVYGGLDAERNEHMTLWRWDTSAESSFHLVHMR